MRIIIKGVEHTASRVSNAPIARLFELHRLSGLEGRDVLDGMIAAADDGVLAQRSLMALAALVWLAKREAGETVGFEEAVADLSLEDIQILPDLEAPAAPTPDPGEAPDPTPRPAFAAVESDEAPPPVEVPSPSPSPTYPNP